MGPSSLPYAPIARTCSLARRSSFSACICSTTASSFFNFSVRPMMPFISALVSLLAMEVATLSVMGDSSSTALAAADALEDGRGASGEGDEPPAPLLPAPEAEEADGVVGGGLAVPGLPKMAPTRS